MKTLVFLTSNMLENKDQQTAWNGAEGSIVGSSISNTAQQQTDEIDFDPPRLPRSWRLNPRQTIDAPKNRLQIGSPGVEVGVGPSAAF